MLLLQRLAWIGAVATALVSGAVAQRKDDESWKEDPYTKGDPKVMRQLGYVSFGPLVWGDDHDTNKIHSMMPEAKILWVETAHFRIGSSLGPLKLPKASKARKRLLAELKQLGKKLPRVKSRPRVIDRWLRLHMYADRLERLYSSVKGVLRVDDKSFPATPPTAAQDAADYMGQGPHLGMPDKYSVLLFKKASNLTRYAVKNGQPMPKEPVPICLNFLDRGSILFGTCSEIVFHSSDPDHRLHTHIRFNATQLLLRGFKYFRHAVPAWVSEGTSNLLLRAQDPETHEFSGMKDWIKTKTYPKKWDVYARRLASNGFGRATKELVAIQHPGQMTFNDHICAWSLVDFLRQIDGGARFAEFYALLKAPMPHKPGRIPTYQTILAAQEAALQSVFGFNYETLEAAWKKFVLRSYPRRAP